MHRRNRLLFSSVLLAAALGYAQPSGGPYGPIDQRYEVPKAAHVYFVAPDGKPDAPGTLAEPTTIEKAIERVVTGDAIVLRGGVYRTGNLEFNQGVAIQPYLDERPILKGTEVPQKWETLRNGVWRTPWKKLFPAGPLSWWVRGREGVRTPMHRFNNDMVFIDGRMLQSAHWEGGLDANSYFIDYKEGYVYIGTDPAGKLVEITAHDGALVRATQDVHGKKNDRKGPVIRGITFTQYAWRAIEIEGKRRFTVHEEVTDEPLGLADPATFGKEVIGTTLENVTISYCSRVAGYFRGDGLIIRNSLISDTSTEGVYVIGSSDVLLEKNIIRRNNIENLTGYFPSAVKIFNQTRRVVVRDNLVLENPNSNGVWYDVGNRDGVFVDNYVEDALVGFFFEISRGMTVAGNVFVRCGRGSWILNSADARVYNNTYLDAPASFGRTQRSAVADHFGWHPATGPDVHEREGHVFVNNLMVASESFTRPLADFEQQGVSCEKLPNPQAKEIGGNVYVRAAWPGAAAPSALIVWSPNTKESCTARAASLEEFRKIAPAFEQAALQLDRTPRTVLRGPDFHNFRLRETLPGGQTLPADILKLLGWSEKEAKTQGAFPFGR